MLPMIQSKRLDQDNNILDPSDASMLSTIITTYRGWGREGERIKQLKCPNRTGYVRCFLFYGDDSTFTELSKIGLPS